MSPRQTSDTPARASTAIRVDEAILDRLDAEAARRGIGRNTLITWLIERNLPAYEAIDLEALTP